MTVEIPLRPASKALVALVDDADAPVVSGYQWAVHSAGYAYTQIPRARAKATGVPRTLLMHRLILGAVRGQKVDHEDGDNLNNRRTNIRICTTRQNNQNRIPSGNGASPYKGVYQSGGVWRTKIHIEGKQVHLGSYAEATMAAEAYDAAARYYFGVFAKTNFAGEMALSGPDIRRLCRLGRRPSSGFPGVSIGPHGKGWRFRVQAGKHVIQAHGFQTEAGAAKAREAVMKVFEAGD